MSTKPKRCIYCPEILKPATRWAHVWPDAMGGRLKSRAICCDNCNNSIGALEDQLRACLLHANATMGARNGEDEPIVAPLKIDGKSFKISGSVVNLQMGGASYDLAGKRLVVKLPAGLANQAEAVGKHLRRQRRTTDDITIEPGEEPQLPPSGLREHDLRVGGSIVDKRVFAKMAVELLAFFDHSLALRPELSEARRFIRHGSGTLETKPDLRSPGSGISLPAQPEMLNLVEVWSFTQSLFFRVVFLRWIAFTGTLTTSWNGGKFRAVYGFDARKPTDWFKKSERRDGKNLAVWLSGMKEEVGLTVARELKAASARLQASTKVPSRETPPSLDQLRAAVTEWLAKEPRRAKGPRTGTKAPG